MSKYFIPHDRIGLQTCQPSIGGTYAVLNRLLAQGIAVGWHLGGLRLPQTPLWPEGHYYQGGFSLEATSAARELLEEGRLLFEELPALPPAQHQLRSLKIALYNGRGADSEFAKPLVDVLAMGGYRPELIADADIRAGKLRQFDVLMVPGSPDAGECYYAGLGDKGYDEIRGFVADRGHYLGICGGAYLPLTSYDSRNPYWLNLVEATDSADLDYWRAGSGFVRVRVDNSRHPIFSSLALGSYPTVNCVYWEGPAITVMGGNVQSLAHFEMLLASGKDPLKPHWDLGDNTMAAEAVQGWYNSLSPALFDKLLRNKTAFAEASYGQNKLLLYSPHPEMGNLGSGPWAESLNFLLIYNGLCYLAGH